MHLNIFTSLAEMEMIFTGLKTDKIMVLIIKGTSDNNIKQAAPVQEIGDRRVVQARYILVDVPFKKVHKCQYNKETFARVLEFLKK